MQTADELSRREFFVAAAASAASRIGSNPMVLENDAMRVEVDRTKAIFRLIDKATGQNWEPDPWIGSAGLLVVDRGGAGRRELVLSEASDITVEAEGNTAVAIGFRRWRLPGAGGTLEAEVKVRLVLPAGRAPLRAEVLAVNCPAGWDFVELEYPSRLGALVTDVDDGYTVVPYFMGCLVPSKIKNWKEPLRCAVWAWDDGPWTDRGVEDVRIQGWQSISMPWFGAVRGASALACIVETENDASLRLVLNSNDPRTFARTGRYSPYPRVAVTSPIWLAERRRLGYARSILYEFLPHGSYVTIAKRYRKFAAERGLVVTLQEKVAKAPQLSTVLGGPWFHLDGGYPWHIDWPAYRFKWNDVRRFVDDITGYAGAQRAMLTLWIGYQNFPPDSYPFHPAQGTLEELRGMVEYARQRNVLINFYHGYPALLDDAPNGDPGRARKSNEHGQMGSRWGRHCPAFYPAYARKNLPPTLRDSGIVCDYSDIFTSTSLGECWDKRHPLTRTQDLRSREETMKYILSLGLFSGSEWPTAYSMPYFSYYRNGTAGSGSHWILAQFPVPLFNLVFKDCAMMYSLATGGAEMIRDLAAGCHFEFPTSMREYYAGGRQGRDEARARIAFFQEWDRATCASELLSHEFVEELNGPYRTRFSDGSEALVNPTSEVRVFDRDNIQPGSLLLRFADGRRVTAKPRTGFDLAKA